MYFLCGAPYTAMVIDPWIFESRAELTRDLIGLVLKKEVVIMRQSGGEQVYLCSRVPVPVKTYRYT
jgi:hypothetical protein